MPPGLSDLLPVLAGLASAATWGAGDFAGGLATRRGNVFGVVTISLGTGLLLLVGLALLVGEAVPPTSDLLWGGAAGIVGGLAVALLYWALAAGQMGVAAPITAVLAAAIPVVVGIATEGAPEALQIVGFVLAVVGVWLLARPESGAATQRGLWIAVLAGIGIGLFLVLLDQAGTTALYWPLAAARLSSFLLVATIYLVIRRKQDGEGGIRLGLAALAGLFDVAGNALFLLAAQTGRLDVASVISSLYPVSTIVLALILLRERITRSQFAGIGAALLAVVLIAA